MKIRAYVRIAKNGYKYKLDASTKSNEAPLKLAGSYGQGDRYLPTVGFAVDFNVPDEMFSKASVVIAEIDLKSKEVKILSEIPKPEKKK